LNVSSKDVGLFLWKGQSGVVKRQPFSVEVTFVNHNDDILGAKIRRKNAKRDILHKNIASEYDILQEMAFQNAIFYIITPQF
jgi:hypothetical protein